MSVGPGDLIETFKILNGIANYGDKLFKRSTRGDNLLIRPNMHTKSQHGFISSRVVRYWNRLPATVKAPITDKSQDGGVNICNNYQKNMVNNFKNRLDNFQKRNISQSGQFWELSQEIFSRINDERRDDYVSYMLEHADVARRRKINTR